MRWRPLSGGRVKTELTREERRALRHIEALGGALLTDLCRMHAEVQSDAPIAVRAESLRWKMHPDTHDAVGRALRNQFTMVFWKPEERRPAVYEDRLLDIAIVADDSVPRGTIRLVFSIEKETKF